MSVCLYCTPYTHLLQIITADFDNPSQPITTTAAWFNLSITLPISNCPQLPHNSSAWVALMPKNTITLPTPGIFYDGVIWMAAQNFLVNTCPLGLWPCQAWSTGARPCVSDHALCWPCPLLTMCIRPCPVLAMPCVDHVCA